MKYFKHTKLLLIGLTASVLTACTTVAPNYNGAPTANKSVVDAFFAAMQAEDQTAAHELLADGAMIHAPYNPNGDASDKGVRSFPAKLYVSGAMQTYDNLVWVNRQYSIADNGKTVWVEALGRLTVAQTGGDYHNRYVFKIEFDGTKIASITEYTNVATLTNSGVVATVD